MGLLVYVIRYLFHVQIISDTLHDFVLIEYGPIKLCMDQ